MLRRPVPGSGRSFNEWLSGWIPCYSDPSLDLFETFSFHERLHRRIAECTGCPALCEAIAKNHILVLNWLYNSASNFSDLPPRCHQSLIEVLSMGDPNKADEKMRQHVRSGWKRFCDGWNLFWVGTAPNP